MFFGGLGIWIVTGILYGIAVIWCWVRESAQIKQREAEHQERRRIQNAEWDEQLRTNPTLRLLIALSSIRNAREELRQIRREDSETLAALRAWDEKREHVDWKREGF